MPLEREEQEEMYACRRRIATYQRRIEGRQGRRCRSERLLGGGAADYERDSEPPRP